MLYINESILACWEGHIRGNYAVFGGTVRGGEILGEAHTVLVVFQLVE